MSSAPSSSPPETRGKVFRLLQTYHVGEEVQLYVECIKSPESFFVAQGEWVTVYDHDRELRAHVLHPVDYGEERAGPMKKGRRVGLLVSAVLDLTTPPNQIVIDCASPEVAALVWKWLQKDGSIQVSGFEHREFRDRLVEDEPLTFTSDESEMKIDIG